MLKQFSLKMLLPFFALLSALSCLGIQKNEAFSDQFVDGQSHLSFNQDDRSASLFYFFADSNVDNQDEEEEDELEDDDYNPSFIFLKPATVFAGTDLKNTQQSKFPAQASGMSASVPSYILHCCLKICFH